MRRLLWTLIAAGGLALAQDKPVQKLIEVKYANPDRLLDLLRRTNNNNIQVSDDSTFHLIIVRGSELAVAEVEAIVKKYDVAPANIEMTVYMISGSVDPKAIKVDDVPAELSSTVKQLHGLFPYKSYRVLQSFVLRSREGRGGRDSGTLTAPDYAKDKQSPSADRMGVNSSYDFRFGSIALSGGTPRVMHIDGMFLTVSTATGKIDKEGHAEQASSTISSDLDVGEGQKIVVGKSNLHGSEDALILVITSKVIE